ncbi:hypothetical protein M011DRAFT_190731 [Sporormia fimetaria CBS 119925]|uniref:Uncharacterized protein n=1 Tax=Sporormia fimetaria CBS 119925 TaxID=1340428 RepID=A0A6A6VMH9_9PLEO|nr:hypothetical protein M011DRAFT_190731 [Sporormia fimetaria CBS 119925]
MWTSVKRVSQSFLAPSGASVDHLLSTSASPARLPLHHQLALCYSQGLSLQHIVSARLLFLPRLALSAFLLYRSRRVLSMPAHLHRSSSAPSLPLSLAC